MPSIKKTSLQRIIDEEGITKAELSRLSGVNSTTINGLCKGIIIVNGKIIVTKDSTKSKIVNSINKMVTFEKYSFEDVFPSPKK